MTFRYYGKNWPWMKLPVATNQTHCCHCFFGDELSWTETGGWVGREGSIQPEKMEGLFREGIDRGMGRRYTLRLRIPADAAAGKFTEAAQITDLLKQYKGKFTDDAKRALTAMSEQRKPKIPFVPLKLARPGHGRERFVF